MMTKQRKVSKILTKKGGLWKDKELATHKEDHNRQNLNNTDNTIHNFHLQVLSL